MQKSSKVYLIRHAESRPDSNIPESDWPLSEVGKSQAEQLIEEFKDLSIDVIASSPFPRALETLRPLAKKRNKSILIENDLRERKLCNSPRKDWKEILVRSWKDFSFSLPNCESGNECQRRIKDCISALVGKFQNQTILLSSHGNAIALYLNSLDDTFGYQEWKKMKNPDIFEILFEGNSPVTFHRKIIKQNKASERNAERAPRFRIPQLDVVRKCLMSEPNPKSMVLFACSFLSVMASAGMIVALSGNVYWTVAAIFLFTLSAIFLIAGIIVRWKERKKTYAHKEPKSKFGKLLIFCIRIVFGFILFASGVSMLFYSLNLLFYEGQIIFGGFFMALLLMPFGAYGFISAFRPKSVEQVAAGNVP